MSPSTNLDAAQVRREVLEQARTVLKCESVDAGDHFMDIGGDSLVAPILAKRIGVRLGHRPQLEDIFTKSFGELADLMAARLAREPSST